ncbi:MAG: c-type cytochrome [Betaproteobacteria bacterium]|nr:c-type cytochrome [Betaproteobacteria bacterium]
MRALARIALGVSIAFQLSACGMWWDAGDTAGFSPESTFRKFFARAESGDAESQNAVGYMLYHGEGVQMDRTQAQSWFRRAAERGNARAQRNLAIIAAHGPFAQSAPHGGPRLDASGNDVPPGEALYLTFCSGCHGVNGISAYEHSPSFAFGERLDKNDAALMRSLREGIQEMPGWDGKLSRRELTEVMSFVRRLRDRYDAGVGQPLRAAPAYYYLFGPMEARRLGMPPALR